MIVFLVVVAATLLFFLSGRLLLPDEPIIVFGGAVFLGFITKSLINKFWSKGRQSIDRSEIFPSLNRKALERWGKKWGEEYEHLNKVVLFDPPLKYPLDVSYILYFDFDTSTPEGKKSEEIFNEINAFQNNVILDTGFQEIYRNQPESGFRDDWFVSIVEYSGFNEEYSWEIYQKENGRNQIDAR